MCNINMACTFVLFTGVVVSGVLKFTRVVVPPERTSGLALGNTVSYIVGVTDGRTDRGTDGRKHPFPADIQFQNCELDLSVGFHGSSDG